MTKIKVSDLKDDLSYEKFLNNKDAITTELEKAIFSVLSEMGDDIKGVAWFSSVELL